MKTVMVAGINGFVGHHLANELHHQGVHVIGTGMEATLSDQLVSVVDEYVGGCNIAVPTEVSKLPLENLDAVVNLAGLAQVGKSFDTEKEYMHTNVAVHTALANELTKLKRRSTRVIAISTGAAYDNHQAMPITEEGSLAPEDTSSPYTKSKVAMERALQTHIDKGLDIIIVRPFNHIGPGQRGGFLVPDLIEQLKRGNTILVGDLSTERDYTDVRDVVKAYVLLATQTKLNHRLYNVCSGTSVSGETMLGYIKGAMNKDDVTVRVDRSRLRPSDPKKVVGSNERIRTDTGWKPTIPVKQTIHDIIEDTNVG